ncbi:MAG: hypothetical protein KAH77_07020 [Thiomargarita sp.]|nr:hypothetical protein [Thiomargarita sp.]
MRKRKKIPPLPVNRKDKKNIRISHQSVDKKPSWRFSTVDTGGKFAWPTGTQDELEIVKKLHSFDSMDWSEIAGDKHHAIKIEHLSQEARHRLKEIKQDDITEIFSFRLQGKSRIICIKDRNIAKLLWYDPEHQVCLSKKKHT